MDTVFTGCIPALMTPCTAQGEPDFDRLVDTAQRLIAAGMRSVVYCGSMGDWPLLTDAGRQEGVARLAAAGVPTIVGTGAQNPRSAAGHAAHAQACGAQGLMAIPRVLSRSASPAAQRAHFAGILAAAPDLPAVIYNSPYYGFETKADLFFDLRRDHPNLIGFKEFGGAAALSYAAEHITSRDPGLSLLVGVDTAVVHGYVRCGATGQSPASATCCRAKSCNWCCCANRRRPATQPPGGWRRSWTRRWPCSLPSTRGRTWCSTTSI